jgi:hypothetical protein
MRHTVPQILQICGFKRNVTRVSICNALKENVAQSVPQIL